MSGLLESLTTASNSLNAQRLGLDVVGQNMANINTPGYSRRSLVLTELPPTDGLSAGRGVTVVEIRAMRDRLVEARLNREQGDTAHDAALAEVLSTAEAAIGLPGQSLDAQLAALFGAFSALADDPASPVARDAIVRQGASLGQAFGDIVNQLTALRDDADSSIRAAVSDANAIAAELADLNIDIATSSHDVESMRDRQGELLSQLGKLSDIAVLQRADGGVDVTLSSGRALVIAGRAYELETTPGGLTEIGLGDVQVTADFTSGRIGGLLLARDNVLPGYIGRLDQLAYDVATAINGVHATGFDGNGAPAGNFFAPPSSVTGAALALAVDPAVVADSAKVAASGTSVAGDNTIARALAALRDGNVAVGGTLSAFGAWSQIVYAVGNDMADARASETSHSQVAAQLEHLRAEASGVSYDEETAHLMRYQRAYEANARYFQTIMDALDVLMEMVR